MRKMSKIRFSVRFHQGGYTYEDLRRIWVEADNLGYYSASLYDLLNKDTLECWTTLSALAAETKCIRLVPLVLANLYRHPSVLAKMAATLDVISDGRLELGIGAGGDGKDHRAFGLPFHTTRVRVEMLAESIGIVKKLWSGEKVKFSGRYYFLDDAICTPPPLQKPRPPLIVGGHGEKYLLKTAAQHADITNMKFDMDLSGIRRVRKLLDRYCKEIGRPSSEIQMSQNTNVVIGDSNDEVARILSNVAAARGESVQEYEESLKNAVVGTPGDCIDKLQEYVDAGISYFFLLFPHPVRLKQLRLFSEHVASHFAD